MQRLSWNVQNAQSHRGFSHWPQNHDIFGNSHQVACLNHKWHTFGHCLQFGIRNANLRATHDQHSGNGLESHSHHCSNYVCSLLCYCVFGDQILNKKDSCWYSQNLILNLFNGFPLLVLLQNKDWIKYHNFNISWILWCINDKRNFTHDWLNGSFWHSWVLEGWAPNTCALKLQWFQTCSGTLECKF